MTEHDAMVDIIENGINLGAGDFVDIDSLKVAMKAIKKQIPQTVLRIQRYWGNGKPSYKDYYCPVCSKQQKRSKGDVWYCERCGQKLVWG